MKNTKTRDLSIDLIKVLCTLWIVGYWHLSNYGDVMDSYAWSHAREMTATTLGVFMFFSGYFLSKYKIISKRDIADFYEKRIKRFYGLYLLSALFLFFGSMLTPKPWFKTDVQLITTILGISTFFKPCVGTLWFMSMLMLFYWITPLIKLFNSRKSQLLAVCVLYSAFILLNAVTESTDGRLFWLMPLYFIGLLFGRKFQSLINEKYGFVFLFVFIACLYIQWPEGQIGLVIRNIILTSLFVVGGGNLCEFLMRIVDASKFVENSIVFLSYSSLSVYLFHREVYQALTIIMTKLHIDITILILYLVFLPIVFIVAYSIQKSYDYLIDRFSNSKKTI